MQGGFVFKVHYLGRTVLASPDPVGTHGGTYGPYKFVIRRDLC